MRPGTLRNKRPFELAVNRESNTTEIIRGNRLISLQSVTEKNGRHLEVHGRAQDGQFVVHATVVSRGWWEFEGGVIS